MRLRELEYACRHFACIRCGAYPEQPCMTPLGLERPLSHEERLNSARAQGLLPPPVPIREKILEVTREFPIGHQHTDNPDRMRHWDWGDTDSNRYIPA